MHVFLIRHFESSKNASDRFALPEGDETLTAAGQADCERFTTEFRIFLEKTAPVPSSIHSSSSQRALLSADRIAQALAVHTVVPHADLRSTHAGPFAGRTLSEIGQLDPWWYSCYQLYQAGVFNLYEFDRQWRVEGKESKQDFERRVHRCFDAILSTESDPCRIIVTSRSVVTAVAIRIARELYGYPMDFYGYVPSSPGAVTWLECDSEGHFKLIALNQRSLS